MAAETGLTTVLAKAQSIDFANQFGKQVKKLLEILGVQRKIGLSAGSTINTYTSSVTLEGDPIAKGDIIPLSEVKLEAGTPIQLTWAKHRKAVAVEDVQAYGFDQAIQRTDDALLREIQKGIRTKLIAQLATGTGTASGIGLQSALANAWGKVQVAFEDDEVKTVAFINTLDAADYLGNSLVSVQSAFGLSYIENFLGVDIVIVTSLVAKGTLYATAADNLVLAYASIAGGEINKAFDFTVDSTGLLGVTHDINKQRLTAETIVLSGMVLYAERLDGVVVAVVGGESKLSKIIGGVTKPAKAALAVTAPTASDEYVGAVTWSPALDGDGKFKASTAYTATIVLAPKAGYTLTGITANYFTVADATATNATGSGVIKAVFPATGA